MIEKVEQEGDLRSQVSRLEKRNIELENTIRKITQSKDGYEVLNNTVVDLSLALIGKNKKEISQSQIQLIKNLFPESQIKAVEGFKTRIQVLESEKSRIMAQSKFIAEQEKSMMKPLRRYSIAIKECISLYKNLGLEQSSDLDSEALSHLHKHTVNFIQEHEESVNEVLPMINTFANNLRGSMEEIGRYSDGLETYNDNIIANIHSKGHTSPVQGKSPQQFDYKDLNFTNPMVSPDSYNGNSVSRLGFSAVLQTDTQEVTPIKELDFTKELSKDPQINLLQELKDFDRDIETQFELPKPQKSSKKTKKKFKKSSKKLKRPPQTPVEPTPADVEEDPFEISKEAESMLNQCETGTIKEVDERDEEDTQFDKDGNRIYRSNHSMQGSGHKGKNSLNELNFFTADSYKYDIIKHIPYDICISSFSLSAIS